MSVKRKRFYYDKEQKKVLPIEEKPAGESVGPHVSKLYPFVNEDFDGTPIEVKSKKHYMELCKQHGVYAVKEFGRGYNISEI